jgi:hypothetical protein
MVSLRSGRSIYGTISRRKQSNVLPVEILERASVIEKDRHAGQMRRGLIALIALFAHFYLETGDPQPQSSLEKPATGQRERP